MREPKKLTKSFGFGTFGGQRYLDYGIASTVEGAGFLYYSEYSIKHVRNHPTLVDPTGDFVELTVNDAMRMMKGKP